jgi:hypothetical protein
MTWLAADDDDGNPSNGTPHMTAIYNAFNRHGIACATPTPQISGCASGPTAAPAVTATSVVSNQIVVSWTAVPNASRYRVLRTEGFAGCDFGKALIFEGNALTYTDNDVADDRTYSYVVQAVGTSGACMGPGSACTQATPVSCAGRLTSDRSVYGCFDSLQIRVTDADLKAPVRRRSRSARRSRRPPSSSRWSRRPRAPASSAARSRPRRPPRPVLAS